MFNGMQSPQMNQANQGQVCGGQSNNNGFLFGGPDLNTIARAKQQAFQNSGNSQMMNMFNPNAGGGDPSCPSGLCGSVMSGPNTTTYNLMAPSPSCNQNNANNSIMMKNGINNQGMSFASNLNSIPVPEHPSSAFPSFDCIMNQMQASNNTNNMMNNGYGGPAAFGNNMPNFINLNNTNNNPRCFKCASAQQQGMNGNSWIQSPQPFFSGMCSGLGQQQMNMMQQPHMIPSQQGAHQASDNSMMQMRTLF